MDHMSPFVAFIGENSYDYCENDGPVEGLGKGGSAAAIQGRKEEDRHGVGWGSVSLDEVMNCDVLRVHMVHSESSYQGGSDNWSSEFAPGVTAPVYHSRDEVY